MSRGYVYLEYEGEENLRLCLTLMGRLLRDKVQSEPKGNGRVLVTLEDAQNSLPVFEASFDALCVDNPGIAKALIIPSPSPCFFEGLELLGPKELDSYAHLCLTHLELLDGAMALLDPLSPEEIEVSSSPCFSRPCFTIAFARMSSRSSMRAAFSLSRKAASSWAASPCAVIATAASL